MPIPMDYQHASEDFERFLGEVVARTGLTTRNQAFTTAEGVLLAFRRRLPPRDALRFAGALPPVLRAIFVADWDMDAPRPAFGGRADWTRDVRALRQDHNFSPDGAVAEVAAALRACLGDSRLDAALAGMPAEAQDFWSVAP
ncbi:Uncharacterized conserved protein, DUF2267 family [Rhodoblastus acidophilus]|uniref:Uncharacterized conserved protein, DUF2267 family n=1 Tax=Rhodoblastus acidophilus TaxID=1074 RepID=A0A212QYI0_RHOAC|nr:DUF2267 domain-containing protein [Rhodoblastus acidophilus]PPQ40780.1 DUF2267 domain-containing protein [Rhodoblastus acidophilus]RAI22994.1 DUF2267 domain-containing protein [Rhodoblastus acidophilus]SNB64808.1 Uncharacterized conserved protein, DUF2267 family [Rhodoblastus acidophilus]